MRKFPLPFRGEGKGEGYAKIESQNAFSIESKTLIWTYMKFFSSEVCEVNFEEIDERLDKEQ